MPVTKEQAITAEEFHYGECTRTVGPRGGVTIKCEVWRRNGVTRYWKTRPDEFKVPIKYGLKNCAYLDQSNASYFHTAEDCPLNAANATTPTQEPTKAPIINPSVDFDDTDTSSSDWCEQDS